MPKEETISLMETDSLNLALGTMMVIRLRPTLSSLVSVNGTTGEVITEVVPGSLFALGKPFFIQAHFTNPNEKDVPDHMRS
jgi:hypothetical protein